MSNHDDDLQAAAELAEAYRQITGELAKVIVGQERVIEELLIALFARGHCLLVGVPGLAKTLMIRSLASALALDFNRIQFTPDLMPSDITGTEVLQLLIVQRTTADLDPRIVPTLDSARIGKLQHVVRRVPIADHVARYALKLARLTRPSESDSPKWIKDFVTWGAGPRASQYLVLGAKARAVLQGRDFVRHDDIRAVALPVLRHRIKTNFSAEAEGITTDEIVRRLIEHVPEISGNERSAKAPNVFNTANAG
jgi:MoxR-like ATPase